MCVCVCVCVCVSSSCDNSTKLRDSLSLSHSLFLLSISSVVLGRSSRFRWVSA